MKEGIMDFKNIYWRRCEMYRQSWKEHIKI